MPLGKNNLFRLVAILAAIVALGVLRNLSSSADRASLSSAALKEEIGRTEPVRASEPAVVSTPVPVERTQTTVAASVHQSDDTLSCDVSSKVVLAGNRPVGTYLCSYFTADAAKAFPWGCELQCFGGQFTCEIHNKASPQMLHTADIVVNHFGPVPSKDKASQRPYLTVFYNGESNSSDPKRSKATYHAQYDLSVSFLQSRPLYFTWTKRFEPDFLKIAAGTFEFPKWNQQRTAIAIFVSRCKKGGREHVIRSLAAHFPVYSFGKCARTHTLEQEHPECAGIASRYPQKLCVLSKYKFLLALDNSRETDYVTEKVYHGLMAGSVPVYDGAPNGEAFLPGGWSSVVRLDQFREGEGFNYAGLGKYLHGLAAEPNPAQLAWRGAGMEAWGPAFVGNMQHAEPTCDMCRMAQRKRCRLA